VLGGKEGGGRGSHRQLLEKGDYEISKKKEKKETARQKRDSPLGRTKKKGDLKCQGGEKSRGSGKKKERKLASGKIKHRGAKKGEKDDVTYLAHKGSCSCRKKSGHFGGKSHLEI